MRSVEAILMSMAALLAVAPCASVPPPINVPVVTKYITTEVTTAHQDEIFVLIGQLCEMSQGMAVNVTVLLSNNPDWEPTFGVLKYYIVDSPDKSQSQALCTNMVGGKAGPNCLIKSWPSSKDIYIKATAGGVEAISFSLDAEFFHPTSDKAAYIRAHAPVRIQKSELKEFYALKVGRPPVYLKQIVTLAFQQKLAYHRAALVNFTFCPTPQTGSRYAVRGAVMATDGSSAYAQYICDKVPCVVDGVNVIAHDGNQLPTNVVTTASGQWKTLYSLIVCWGGVYDPNLDQYIGTFRFTAEQV